ncbi:tubulin glycylase 3B-like isoform X2 [Teleopsis dalmanni]|uniref:tubulin glycylase 3B-like isoform X2 n=1 Tax=Teleopsis dalmanni TaxID=139649 RepID=UPI0018CE6A77|nr:tubulin glycylase 3B-like isoform X2 [Teleopsis dalmanni]XP_037939150.1 tubulin glycylase 3B-like isoform X2 [Teleopsis dalmanni]
MEGKSSTRNSKNDKNYNHIGKIQEIIHYLDGEIHDLVPKYPINTALLGISAQTHENKDRKNVNDQECPLPINIDVPIDKTAKIEVRMLLSFYSKQAHEAFQKRRLFIVYGNFYTLRHSLLKRRWVEKLSRNRYANLQALPNETLIRYVRPGNEFEQAVMSNLVSRYPPFFIWQPKAMKDSYAEELPYRNRIRRGRTLDFSTKIGLIGCSEQASWYRKENICGMKYPRFYRLGGTSAERLAFIDDFCQTQCRNFVRFLWNNFYYIDLLIDEEHGTEPADTVNFAIKNVVKQLNEFSHTDLDDESWNPENDKNFHIWQDFLKSSNNIIFNRSKLKMNRVEFSESIKSGKLYLQKIFNKHPDFHWDGCRNLWILKPGFRGCGFGIIVRNDLDEILEFASINSNRRYIVQKYIERPLIIYKTKFDIRMYMLLSVNQKNLSIWLYKDCYLRFSSQQFDMSDLREVIHLTNNSIQKRYKNPEHRDKRLPGNNMWSLAEFKKYLSDLPETEEIWNTKIYPGFAANLIAVVMASLEDTTFVENAFELFGCDFMLDEEFNPILIEINATPDLSRSTKVTATICPMMLKDMVKVVVDLPKDPSVVPGLFELAFKVRYAPRKDFQPNYCLSVSGIQMQGTQKPIELKVNSVTTPKSMSKLTQANSKQIRSPSKISKVSLDNNRSMTEKE